MKKRVYTYPNLSPNGDSDLRQRINDADTIPMLDKLRMDIVSSKDRTLLTLWQVKFWERKKKYSFEELRQYGIQERIDELTRAVVWSTTHECDCCAGLASRITALKDKE